MKLSLNNRFEMGLKMDLLIIIFSKFMFFAKRSSSVEQVARGRDDTECRLSSLPANANKVNI